MLIKWQCVCSGKILRYTKHLIRKDMVAIYKFGYKSFRILTKIENRLGTNENYTLLNSNQNLNLLSLFESRSMVINSLDYAGILARSLKLLISPQKEKIYGGNHN